MRLVRTVALAGVLTLVVAACGNDADDASANRRWAKRYCTGLAAWQEATTTSSTALQEYLKDPNLDTTAAKVRLTQYLEEATVAADRLAADLRSAGIPAISERRRAVTTLREGSAAVQRAITEATAEVDSLPVDDAQQFRAGTERANAILSRGFEAFDDALQRLNRLDDDGDLLEAERSVRACRAQSS